MACSAASENADSAKHLPRWCRVWTGWGIICAGLISCIDRSPVAFLLWMPLGILIGRFGLPISFQLLHGTLALQSKIFGDLPRLPKMDPTESHLAWKANHTLALVDPNKRPWEILLPAMLFAGSLYGVFFGPIFGALWPLSEGWPMTAFRGALFGLAIGVVLVGLLVVIVLVPMLWFLCHGPSPQRIRPVVERAIAEAERLRHEDVKPGHLLFALIDEPEGAVAAILAKQEFDAQEIDDFVRATIQQEFAQEWPVPDTLYATISAAVDQAKALKHRYVEPGHLLLGLLVTWPSQTLEVLEQIGLDPSHVREDVIAQLQSGR